jgi:hypothetical protein
MTACSRVIIGNEDGRFALITVIDAETEGHSSDVDKVVFEYEILPE